MHRYRYTIILIATFLTAWAIGRLGLLDPFASNLAKANHVIFSAIAGALYSFSFTAAFAVVLFSNLTLTQSEVVPLSIIAATGGLVMDLTLLRFIKGFMAEELTGHAKRVVERFTNHKPVRLMLQVIGALVIMSPFPEELGLTLLGISHLSFWRILSITYILDIIGAYLLINLVSTII